MTPENETGVLGLLLALAAALYAIVWLVAGPATYQDTPATVLPVGHAPLGRTRHPARQFGPRAPVRRPAGAAHPRQIIRCRRGPPRRWPAPARPGRTAAAP